MRSLTLAVAVITITGCGPERAGEKRASSEIWSPVSSGESPTGSEAAHQTSAGSPRIEDGTETEAEAEERELLRIGASARAGDLSSFDTSVPARTAKGRQFTAIVVRERGIEREFVEAFGPQGVLVFGDSKRLGTVEGRAELAAALLRMRAGLTQYESASRRQDEEIARFVAGGAGSPVRTKGDAALDRYVAAVRTVLTDAEATLAFARRARPTHAGGKLVFREPDEVPEFKALLFRFLDSVRRANGLKRRSEEERNAVLEASRQNLLRLRGESPPKGSGR